MINLTGLPVHKINNKLPQHRIITIFMFRAISESCKVQQKLLKWTKLIFLTLTNSEVKIRDICVTYIIHFPQSTLYIYILKSLLFLDNCVRCELQAR